MLCWSCFKEIPETASRCQFCEAEVHEEPTFDELYAVHEQIQKLSPQNKAKLFAVFADSANGEDFVNRLTVGQCPACHSWNCRQCGDDPDIEDETIGACLDCGQMWCLACHQALPQDTLVCPQCDLEDDDLEDDTDDPGEPA